jgi:DNA-binding SARP family transcriptional activator
MAAEMEFNLLGPLIVRSAGVLVPVRQGRQRVVLAALLLDPGRVVLTEELAEVLWGPASPPPSANVTIRNYVKRLRQALGDAGYTRISTAPRGYRISVDPREVDVSRFEAMVMSAQAAEREGAWEQAAARAHSALSLWRGQPLADVESEVLALREVPRLAELRTQALEIGIGADLELGGHADVITDLRELIRAQPLREHLRALLMLALYRSGRQAEALAAYQDARRILVEELGADPRTRTARLARKDLVRRRGTEHALGSDNGATAAACRGAALHRPAGRTPRAHRSTGRHGHGQWHGGDLGDRRNGRDR